MKRLKYTLFMLFLLGITVSFSSPTLVYGYQSGESTAELASGSDMNLYILSNQYEALLEQRINNRLSQYFPTSSFIVTVEITLLENTEAFGLSTDNEDNRNDDSRLYTAVPQFLLPELGDPNAGSGNDIIAQLGIDLRNITVRINLDQEADFSNQDQAFLRFAIESIIKYDADRGDQILIQSRSFPEALSANGATTNSASSRANDLRLNSFADSLRAYSGFNSSDTGELIAITSSLENRINLLFLAMIVLIGAGVAFIVYGKNSGSNNSAEGSAIMVSSDMGNNFRDEVSVSTNMVRNLNHTIKNEGLIEYSLSKDDSKEDRETESLRFLMKLTSERPADMARILEYWFSTDMHKTIQIILSVDIKILIMLRPYITESVYKELVSLMNEYFEMDDYEYKHSLEELAREVKGFEQPQSFIFKYQPVKDFNFIQLMKIEELKSLIELLDLTDTALVLSHCSRDIIQRLSDMIETQYLNEIIKQAYVVRKMPLSEYRNHSNKIFKEIHLNQQGDHLPDSLVTDVVSIIEGLNMEKQQDIIRYMKEEVDAYTQDIAQKVVTLDAIVDLTEEDLAKVIRPMKSDILALAIRGFGSGMQDRILALRPEREQVLIKRIMSSEESSLKDIKQAQYQLLNQLRIVVRQSETVNA